jgi:spore coat protein CotH
LREKVTADLFREAGVPSAQTAFYAVTVDYGEGPIYLGLYTAVELVDDTVIETQFSDDSGNVYKPEGSGATFTEGSFTEASFDKETNQEDEDYSDILALFEALHSDLRLTDPDEWRIQLEEVFDVDTFLNWLAVNTLIQNWDTYGVMNHNYYLYNNPETGQLVWIPWDNNESLKSGEGVRPAISIDLSDVGGNWPLISYLRDDPVYFQKYQACLESFLEDSFVIDEVTETFSYYHDLIAPYVIDEAPDKTLAASQRAFEDSVDDLTVHLRDRIKAAEVFLEY